MKSCLLFFLLLFTHYASAQQSLAEFKTDENGKLIEWTASRNNTVSVDTETDYQGRASVKFDRRKTEDDTSSFIIRRIPLNFEAEVIELRAVLRAKGTGGYAGANILLRQDRNDSAIEFINSQPFVTGSRDTEWQRVRISQKVNPQAESLVIGAVLAGTGEAWVNDFELWADGQKLTAIDLTRKNKPKQSVSARDEIPKIDFDWATIDDKGVQELSAFIQVWGFLKYFHPDVAEGKYDWDLEFVKATQSIVTGTELDKVLNQLLDKIGIPQPNPAVTEATTGQVIVANTAGWYVESGLYSPRVVGALKSIQSQRPSFKDSKYASLNELEMATFTGEDYFQINYLEQETRLLALARLWNVIEYWFPWKDLPPGWYAELKDLTKAVARSTSKDEFIHVLQRLLGQINDGHATLSESIFRSGACRLPFAVRYIEDSVVISRLYTEIPDQQVQVGDKLLGLDGKSVDDLLEHWLPYYSASNEPSRYFGLANELLYRACDKPTKVTLSRQAQTHEIEISDYETVASVDHSLPGDVVQTLENGVVYLKVAGVSFDAVDEAIEKAQNSGKLIIDARGYPSEFILYYLGSRLTSEPRPFAQLARVHPYQPGDVTLIDHVPTLEPYEPVALERIAILVDETTISQAEFSVLAWREIPNSTVIGSTTAGAVGNVSRVPLPNGMQVYFTGLRVLDKNGKDVQYRGIEPDIYIKPTISDLKTGRDVVIDKAIDLLGSE